MFLYSCFFQFSRGTCWCAKKVQNCKVLKHYVLCTFSVSRSFHEKNQKTYDISQGKFMYYNLLCILAKVCTLKNNTNLKTIFCLVKSSKNDFIFSPALHLIIWVLILTKKFQKIAILKILQLIFFRGVKT